MYYKWNFSWKEILKFYSRKQKIYANRRSIDFDFLVNLAQAALGGKSDKDTVSIDTGEGLEDLTDDKAAALRAALGDDYDKVIGN